MLLAAPVARTTWSAAHVRPERPVRRTPPSTFSVAAISSRIRCAPACLAAAISARTRARGLRMNASGWTSATWPGSKDKFG